MTESCKTLIESNKTLIESYNTLKESNKTETEHNKLRKNLKKNYDIIEVSITQNDNIFSQVYLFICYWINTLRMTSVKSEI